MGLGNIIGGALQGFGKGTAEVGRMAADERRQIALQEMRSKSAAQQTEQRYDLADRNASRSDSRSDFFGARNAERNSVAKEASDGRKFEQQVKLKKIDFENDKQMTKLRGSIDRDNTEAGVRLRASIEQGEVKQVLEGSDGQYHAVFGDGKTQATGVGVVPDAPKGGGYGSVAAARGERGGGLGGPNPTPTPAAASQPAAKKAPPKQGQVSNGYRFNGGDPANSNNWSKVS